jgi:hypothetical protein
MFERFKTFIERYVIQDVPPELEFCEFGCSRRRCEQGNWDRCPNRSRSLEEAELFAAQNVPGFAKRTSESANKAA